MALKYYYNDLTPVMTASDLGAIYGDMHSRNLTWEEQKKNIMDQLRYVQEETPWKNDNGAADKQALVDAVCNNFFRPILEQVPTLCNSFTPTTQLPSNNPDDYEWLLITESGFGIFNGDYQQSYGFRGSAVILYGTPKTATPTNFSIRTWNGRYVGETTNSPRYYQLRLEIVPFSANVYIRSDTTNPYTYRYWDTHSWPAFTQTNSNRVQMATRAVHFAVLFSQVEGYFLQGAALGSSGGGGNPDGDEGATSGKYPSTEMGGNGTFDDSTDLSDISIKPSINIADLGFFSVWNPTASELRTLADYVWNDPTNYQQWGQLIQEGILKPLDYVLGLSLIPVSSSDLTLSNRTFCMGGIVFDGRLIALGINLTMNQVQEQFVDVNLGTLSLKEYFGSFLDYTPYSSVSIYLPYYGVAELSMNELQNADSIQLVYRINVIDGSCAIKILVDRQTSAAQNGSIPLKHVLYEYYTNVATHIPVTQGQNAEYLKMAAQMITQAVAVAAPIAGAGIAALAGGAGAAASGAATMADIAGSASASAAANGGKVASAIGNAAQGAQKIVNAMPSGGQICRGNVSGMNAGLAAERKPYLIVTRPIQVLPEGYKEELGYTASIKTTLGALGSGFVKFDSVDLSSLNCEESERLKLLDLLTNTGVYI